VDIKENNKSKKYSRAQKKVKELKMFYNHLVVYITCSIILFILSYNNILFMNIISPKILNKIEFLKWINWQSNFEFKTFYQWNRQIYTQFC